MTESRPRWRQHLSRIRRRFRGWRLDRLAASDAVHTRLTDAVAWADRAVARREWETAAQRWETVLDRFGAEVNANGYRRLTAVYREMGRYERAATVLHRGRLRHPHDPKLAIEWAQQAMVEENWAEAVARWGEVADRFWEDLSPKSLSRMAVSHWEYGDIATARDILLRANERFPDDGLLARTEAQLELVAENWGEAFAQWDRVVERFPGVVRAKDLARLIVAHRRQQQHARAAEIADAALARYPNDVRLTAEAAHLAMAARDWPRAIQYWQRVSSLRVTDDEDPRAAFPPRSPVADWFDEAWQQIAWHWDTIVAELPTTPDAALFQAVGETLRRTGLLTEGEDILRRGVTAHPRDARLALAYVSIRLLRVGGSPENLESLADAVADVNGLASVLHGLAELERGSDSQSTDDVTAMLARNAASLDAFRTAARPAEGLPAFHVIRVPRGSSLEVQLRAGRYLSRHVIRQRVREVSERDQWEEMHADENLVMQRARRIADEFGKRFERLPHLPAETLADAVLFFCFHEVCLAEPMKRIAADIAAEADTTPVFIESSSLDFRYLDGYTFSRFDVIYLYTELRRLGVNAFLCVAEEVEDPPATAGDVGRSTQIVFRPGARAILPRSDITAPDSAAHDQAVVPAGMRSIRRVLTALGNDALVYASGSIVKEFAYDRSIRQAYPLEPGATIHPSRGRLATIAFDLWPAATLRGVQVDDQRGSSADAAIEVTSLVGGDWLEWLDAAVGGYLEEMSIRCAAEVAVRQIRTLHVSDHIFTESAIFGDAVKRGGGRVVLWPHSANPVHVTMRRADSFDEVHAVTRAGVSQWEQHFPDKPVSHSPSLMLDPPEPNTIIDPSQPLNVVLIGGRSTLRELPIMDRGAHEQSYRHLMRGLEQLQAELPIEVRFKPRGVTGEHEMWLYETVGRAASWQPVLEHPLRLQLPNMLFVSVSMGSSALLEGLSRGVPGLIVRDFRVRDYTTIDEEAFPVRSSHDALEVIESCARPDGLAKLLEGELAYYMAELHA